MKENGLGIILTLGIVALTFFVFGMIAQMHFVNPQIIKKLKYQPTPMTYEEFDSNDIIFHGPLKITFLDPNQFRRKDGKKKDSRNNTGKDGVKKTARKSAFASKRSPRP